MTLVREAMAVIAMRAGGSGRARAIEEGVIAEYRTFATPLKIADALRLLTATQLRQGDVDAARRSMAETISIARRIGDQSAWATDLQLGALVHQAEGRPREAAIFCGAFRRLQETSGPFLTPATGLGLRDPIEVAGEQLDAETLATLESEGRSRPLEDLLRELEGLGPAAS